LKPVLLLEQQVLLFLVKLVLQSQLMIDLVTS
jgi:hypothetical protein